MPLEEDAFLDHHDRRLDVSRDACGGLELDPVGRDHVARDLPVHDHRARPDGPLDPAALTNDERVAGIDLAAELAAEHHGPTTGVMALELRAFVHEGIEVAPEVRRVRASSFEPHGRLRAARQIPRPRRVRIGRLSPTGRAVANSPVTRTGHGPDVTT